jgi:hypothetical protein
VIDQNPAGPVRWRYWPPEDQPATNIFCNLHPGPMSSASHVNQILKLADDLNTTNSAWILSVSANNKPIYITRLRTTSLHGKTIAIKNISRSY